MFFSPIMTTEKVSMEFNATLNLNTTEDFNISELSADLTFKVPKVTFLLLFGVSGLIGNTLLMLVILKGKKSVMSILMVNLCFVALTECWINMSFVLGALFSDGWVFGDALCRFHAFSMSTVFIELVLTLLCISIERFVAMKFCIDPKNYLTIRRILFVIFYTWIHSVAFSLPLLIGTVPVIYREPLHLCSISDSSSLTYICLTSVLCFIIPIIAMTTVYVLIIRIAFKEQKTFRTVITHYADKGCGTMNVKQEVTLCKYGGVLFGVWVFLGVPYIISAYIRQYQFSYKFQQNNFLKLLNYPWSVDITFVYLRFLYSAILPILTFSLVNYLWVNFKDLILCRRRNSIGDVRSSKNQKVQKMTMKKQPVSLTNRGPSFNTSTNQVFNVPVLFATSDGIHIETNESEASPHSKSENDIIEVKEKLETTPVIPKGKHCDVVYPAELEYFRQDTSDYDSCGETEVYSTSQPVSMRQASQGEQLTQRSISQPEVCQSKTSNFTTLQDVKKSFGADSGLDLSASDNSLRQTKNIRGSQAVTVVSAPLSKTWTPHSASVRPSIDKSAQPIPVESSTLSVQSKKSTPSSIPNKPSKLKYCDNGSETHKNTSESQNIGSDLPLKEGRNAEITVPEQYLSVSQRVKRDSKSKRGFGFLELQLDEQNSKYEHVTFTSSHSIRKEPDTNSQKSPNMVKHKPPKSAPKKSKPGHKLRNLGETFEIPIKNIEDNDQSVQKLEPLMDSKVMITRKGHQRCDTSDSQKSLLGSASSNELSSMKDASFPIDDIKNKMEAQ